MIIIGRFRQNGNEYIKHDDHYEMIVISEKYGTFYVQIDLEDFEKCKQYTWGIFHTNDKLDKGIVESFYIQTNKVGLLHRYIMDAPKGYQVDHKDKDTMNNRKSNLRLCTISQNQMNKKIQRNNTSGYPGVFYSKHVTIGAKPWCAKLRVNGKQIYLGYFDTFEEAVEAKIKGSKEFFGEFAPSQIEH